MNEIVKTPVNLYLRNNVFINPDGTNLTAKQFAETKVTFPNQTFIQQYQNNIKTGGHVVFCNTIKPVRLLISVLPQLFIHFFPGEYIG